MPTTFLLEILTPERKFFSGQVETLILKTPEGEMGILAQHAPTITPVAIGSIRIKVNNDWLDAVLTEGFMEIHSNKTVILADSAEWPNEIDTNRAEAAKVRAQERLQSQLSRQEYMRSQAAMSRALARLKVGKKPSSF
jgi:F-type H+-transporting ATPase subunit epsilon